MKKIILLITIFGLHVLFPMKKKEQPARFLDSLETIKNAKDKQQKIDTRQSNITFVQANNELGLLYASFDNTITDKKVIKEIENLLDQINTAKEEKMGFAKNLATYLQQRGLSSIYLPFVAQELNFVLTNKHTEVDLFFDVHHVLRPNLLYIYDTTKLISGSIVNNRHLESHMTDLFVNYYKKGKIKAASALAYMLEIPTSYKINNNSETLFIGFRQTPTSIEVSYNVEYDPTIGQKNFDELEKIEKQALQENWPEHKKIKAIILAAQNRGLIVLEDGLASEETLVILALP